MTRSLSGLTVARSADDAAMAGWDAVLGAEDVFQTTGWLRVLAGSTDVPFRFLLLGDPADPAGTLGTALLPAGVPWPLARPDTVLAAAAEAGDPDAAAARAELPDDLAAALMPSLVCGGRHLGRTRPNLAAGATDADLDRLLDGAEDLAREAGARSVSYLYVDERDQPLRARLAARGYRGHRSGRYAWLPLPPGGLDGYLAGLSAHRARRVLADRRRVAAAGVEVRLEPLSAAELPRLAELEAELFAKHGSPGWQPAQSEEIMRSIHRVLGDAVVLSVARADGRIRGFGLLLRSGPVWTAHRAGFDYGFQAGHGRLPLYNEVLYHLPIAAAPEHGVTAIHYGIGSTEAKLLRGCLATDQHAYVLRLA